MLIPMILELLDNHSLKMSDLDGVALSRGPGSYTGLRVGASTARGISFSRDIPLVTINTLEALAYQTSDQHRHLKWDYILPMLDARRNEVYTAEFDRALNIRKATASIVIDQKFQNDLNPSAEYLICGNGAEKVKTLLPNLKNVNCIPVECSSIGLAKLAQKYFEEEKFEALDHFEPLYLKPPNITIAQKPL